MDIDMYFTLSYKKYFVFCHIVMKTKGVLRSKCFFVE